MVIIPTHTPSSFFLCEERHVQPTMLVIHYTQCPTDEALLFLTSPSATRKVSSHYVIPPEGDRIYKLIDEKLCAHHAGISHWKGRDGLNAHSIGIEIVSWGYTYGWMPPEPSRRSLKSLWNCFMHWNQQIGDYLTKKKIPWFSKRWHPFSPSQIKAIVHLVKSTLGSCGIDPENVVGHADIAPQRKVDPGPQFPWKELAAQGVGVWPNPSVDRTDSTMPLGVDVKWTQQSLRDWGYQVPQTGVLDEETRNVVKVFQMHFRPEKYDGNIDLETMDHLDILLCQRRNRPSPLPEGKIPDQKISPLSLTTSLATRPSDTL